MLWAWGPDLPGWGLIVFLTSFGYKPVIQKCVICLLILRMEMPHEVQNMAHVYISWKGWKLMVFKVLPTQSIPGFCISHGDWTERGRIKSSDDSLIFTIEIVYGDSCCHHRNAFWFRNWDGWVSVPGVALWNCRWSQAEGSASGFLAEVLNPKLHLNIHYDVLGMISYSKW